ncbi:MAG: inositol monophosphatase [Planctomycetaceae bacterium]|nr:inositol monophosphatase [Planctomycetaceae bacterium]MCB9951245.1 inositol monophosphatase [Planctomycetaceae bacterium]
MSFESELIEALREETPDLLRWAGAVGQRLRQFNISLEGKSSGNANTDALTLADISLQELLVAGLRDRSPLFRQCRMEAEEENGDLAAFATEGEYIIALDPIDGTKQFRDRSGDGWAVMLHVRTVSTVVYSLVYAPDAGPTGTWTQVYDQTVKCGPDDKNVPAKTCLDRIEPVSTLPTPVENNVYLIGFQTEDPARADLVTKLGLKGFAPDEMPGSIYPLMASGEFVGSLIHTPNIYDYPVSLHIARVLGGESVWVHNGQPVNFSESWMDDRADMLRLPGIVATATSREVLDQLTQLARDWNPNRYA